MPSHRVRCATTTRGKRTWPSVWRIGPSGVLRPLPDAMASCGGPRLPEQADPPHQSDSYKAGSALVPPMGWIGIVITRDCFHSIQPPGDVRIEIIEILEPKIERYSVVIFTCPQNALHRRQTWLHPSDSPIPPGGLIAIDNVLWNGAVADPAMNDEATEAIRAINTRISTDTRIHLSMAPIGDGLTLAQKK